ncbi:NTP transferase domain-containing protein [Thiomicrospira microaerophila]|uniref:NTP transferase domain-containing protein n=1 Tax=Thiomicrospira microaerophila TaxID=406020 RepID=UPI00200D002B|nr:NTP transferase domain-containing protein [Thiomicrospira microaerophila]UQB43200.1 NTP transferase domain-containing protein [Thiomicrospira microaerophila]
MRINRLGSHADFRLDMVVLCGGEGKRMGGVNKGLVKWQGVPMILHIMDWIAAEFQSDFLRCLQKPIIWVVTNTQADEYQNYLKSYQDKLNIKIIPDRFSGYLGPLAGIDAVFADSQADWLQLIPCDCPQLPPGLVVKLAGFTSSTTPFQIITPWDGERVQPLFSQLHRSTWPSLVHAIEQQHLAAYRWMNQQALVEVDCSDLASGFKNINSVRTLEDKINEASSD